MCPIDTAAQGRKKVTESYKLENKTNYSTV